VKPVPALAEYIGARSSEAGLNVGNPIIVQEFVPGRGWQDTGWRKRASVSWLRKLRREGVTSVGVYTPWGSVADFAVAELLRGTSTNRKG
jgi:hypothetical protein